MPRPAELRRIAGMGPLYVDNLVMADGARHRFLRKIASYAFTPKAINEIEDAGPADRGRAVRRDPRDVELDFVDTVAAPLPMIMIALMLGVPLEDLDTFRRWSDSFIEMSEDTLPANSTRTINSKIGDIIEFRDYFAEQLEGSASRTPATTSSPSSPRPSGKASRSSSRNSSRWRRCCSSRATRPHRGLIAGAGKALAEHPDQRAILVDAPELMPNAVEEFLRYVTPVTHMCRTALDDVEIRGQQIRQGDFLCLLYASANRDEDAWERGDELDVTPRPRSRRRSRSASPSTSASARAWRDVRLASS